VHCAGKLALGDGESLAFRCVCDLFCQETRVVLHRGNTVGKIKGTLAPILRIPYVPPSNLGPETGCSEFLKFFLSISRQMLG
jgi:hypothetical protein